MFIELDRMKEGPEIREPLNVSRDRRLGTRGKTAQPIKPTTEPGNDWEAESYGLDIPTSTHLPKASLQA